VENGRTFPDSETFRLGIPVAPSITFDTAAPLSTWSSNGTTGYHIAFLWLTGSDAQSLTTKRSVRAWPFRGLGDCLAQEQTLDHYQSGSQLRLVLGKIADSLEK
jgi:hypothetical protein